MSAAPNWRQRWIGRALKLFFDLLYHQFAWTYDLVSWTVSVGMWNHWIKVILPDIEGDQILELGHGPGHLQVTLHAKNIPSFGLDFSPQMGRQAYRRLTRQGYTPRLANGAAQTLPYPSNHFDAVIATFPTDYILHPNTIHQIHRVLKPRGKLMIVPVSWITGQGWLHQAAAWLFRITGQGAPDYRSAIDAYAARFEQAGFTVKTEDRQMKNSVVVVVTATPNK